MHGKTLATEWIKNGIILLLLVGLVCLCTLYLLSFQGTSSPDFTREMAEAIDSESLQYRYINYFSESYILPRFIGFSAPSLGEPFGLFRGTEDMETVFSALTPFFGKLFGAEGHVEQLSQGAGQKYLDEALSGDSVYLAFSCDIPTRFLLYLTGASTLATADAGEAISELFLLPEEEAAEGVVLLKNGTIARQKVYTFSALARDSAGRFYRYTTDYRPASADALGFHTNFYVTYNTLANTCSFVFAGTMKTDDTWESVGFSEKVSDTTPILSADLFDVALAAKHGENDAEDDEAMLERFGMNPQMASSYTDETGARYYFDEGESLKISSDGALDYTASAGGIPFSTVFGYTGGTRDYTTADALGAALVFVHSLDTVAEMREREDMGLVLCSFGYEDGVLTLGFGYTYRNMPIYVGGSAERVRVTIRDGAISAVTCDGLLFEATDDLRRIPNLSLSLRAELSAEGAARSSAFTVCTAYVFEDAESEGVPGSVRLPR